MIFGIVRAGARCRFADHAHRHPGLLSRAFMRREVELHKSILQLDRAPLLMGCHPSSSASSPAEPATGRGPRCGMEDNLQRPRFRRRRRGHHRPARFASPRNEPLRLHTSRIRAAAAASVVISSLLDDLGAEFFRGAAQRLGKKLIFRMRPFDQGASVSIASTRDIERDRRRAWNRSARHERDWSGNFPRAANPPARWC